jgi:beta-barrel assembly-enhancing protease
VGRFHFFSGLTVLLFLLSACSKDPSGLITYEHEVSLGASLDSMLISDTAAFRVLSKEKYLSAYQYLDSVFAAVSRSKSVQRPFPPVIRMIENNSLNFMVFPGGFYYLNTGFCKYHENGAQLAGFIAHQMTHTDRRHITGNLEKKFGIDALLDITLEGKKGRMDEIFRYLTDTASGQMVFSIAQEIEASDSAIAYLSGTQYDPLSMYHGIARMNLSLKQGIVPSFTLTHPINDLIVEEILNFWSRRDSVEGDLFLNQYRNFKNGLP